MSRDEKELRLSPDYLMGGLQAMRSFAPKDYITAVQQMALYVALDRMSGGQPFVFTWEEYRTAFMRVPEAHRDGMGFQLSDEGITVTHATAPPHPLAEILFGGEAEEGTTQ